MGTVPEMRAFPANRRAQTNTLENISCQAGENVNTGSPGKKKVGQYGEVRRGGHPRRGSMGGCGVEGHPDPPSPLPPPPWIS